MAGIFKTGLFSYPGKSLLLVLALSFTGIISCSNQKVLVLSDPLSEHFAESNHFFYPFRRQIVFRAKGLSPVFLEYREDQEFSEQVELLLNSGAYDALILSYLHFQRFDIPEGIHSVLLGGSREILFEEGVRVLSTSDSALIEAAGLMQAREADGADSYAVFWNEALKGEEERAIFTSQWPDESLWTERMLVLGEQSGDLAQKIESYFSFLDLEKHSYTVLLYCPPALEDFFKVIPLDENISFILAVPDNPYLPDGTIALISDNHMEKLKAAAAALKSGSPGNTVYVEKDFIRK